MSVPYRSQLHPFLTFLCTFSATILGILARAERHPTRHEDFVSAALGCATPRVTSVRLRDALTFSLG